MQAAATKTALCNLTTEGTFHYLLSVLFTRGKLQILLTGVRKRHKYHVTWSQKSILQTVRHKWERNRNSAEHLRVAYDPRGAA